MSQGLGNGRRRRCGGVVGDSLRAFPPDLGQGANAALEDALLFCNALSAAKEAGERLHGVVKSYEDVRDEDISALIRLMVCRGPYQNQELNVWTALWGLNMLPGTNFSKIAPTLFWPQILLHITPPR